MNAKRLLGHYERIADAPDAIARLRRFILDLAVRGKLVPQDPNDEPASELLKRIAAEKARLVKTGDIRHQECGPDSAHAAFPVISPTGWAITRLATISRRIHYGYTASADAALKDVRMLRITDIQENAVDWSSVPGCLIEADEVDQYKLAKGDILIARTGGTIGKTFLVRDVPVTTVFASYLIRIQGTRHVFDEYLKLFLESPLYWTQLREGARGTGQPNVNGQTLGNLILTLPPLAEQHRIVTKVDELMALCDRLEITRAEREATRDRLTATSLARLNAPDPETFKADARFALDALPALTTRSDQIKQLRQTILNLAVRGILVPQDAKDEPASELRKRVLAQPWKKKRKVSELLPDEDAAALVFPLPTGWIWATVDLLVRRDETVTYGILKPEWVENGVPTVRVTEMKTGVIDVASLPQCDPARASKFKKTTLVPGDLLISKDGTIGKTAFVPPELAGGNITQHMLRFPITEVVFGQFIRLAIDAPFCQSWMVEETKGVALQGVNVGDFRRMPIPLPPLAEQRRIVAKVDELMALCDRLEASLTSGDDTRSRLLDALLAEALAPAKATAMEAVA